MLTEKDYQKVMDRARKTNLERDFADRGAGFAAPADGGPPDLLRTAMTALASGIRSGDWSCAAESLAMLEVLHLQIDPQHRAYRQ